MKPGTLALVAVLMVSSCVSTAGADEGRQEPVEIVESPPDTTAEEDEPIVIVSGPVSYTDDAGAYHLVVMWSQTVDHPDMNVGLDVTVSITLVPLASVVVPVPDVDDDAATAPDVLFEVIGEVRYDHGAVRCDSKWFNQSCEPIQVTDASLRGTASLNGSTLVIDADWRRFGVEREPGRAGIVIGRRGTDSSVILATTELSEVSDALEAAGLIGRSFVVDVHRHRQRRVFGSSTAGNGEGIIELIAQ